MYKICFIFITSINVFKKWDSNQIFSSEFLCSQRFSPYGGSSTEFHWITPLLKLFGPASLVLTVTILIEHKFTAWLFSNNGKQTKCGFCKEEGKWKIQLSFGKKLGKKNIRMSSLSYLSLNLLSSRHCWHGTRKQELLFMFDKKVAKPCFLLDSWRRRKRKCDSFLHQSSPIWIFTRRIHNRTLKMYGFFLSRNYLNFFSRFPSFVGGFLSFSFLCAATMRLT